MKVKEILGVLPLMAVIMITGCENKPKNTDAKDKKVKVEAITVLSRDVPQLGTFTGTIESEVKNNIAPQMPLRIKKVYVEVGDRVGAGQVVAQMDALNLDQTKLQMENNKTEFDRVDELYKIGGISKSVWDMRKLAYEVSETSYKNLQENTMLRSPINGVVTKRNYDNGDMYNMAAPVYVIEQMRPIKLMVSVSESLYTKIKKGMPVEVVLDVYGDVSFAGIVKLIHPSIDPHTRTFPVEIQIKNNDDKIRPGMFARATFNYGNENRILVSDRAVLKQSGSGDKFVYICKDGQAHYTKVVLGQRVGSEYEVLEGLTDGDVVATTGQSRLNQGTLVEIVSK